MCVRVRGQKGQDEGNKRNKGDAEVHRKEPEKCEAPPGLSTFVYYL